MTIAAGNLPACLVKDPTIDVDSLDGEPEAERLISAAYLRVLVGFGLDIP